MQVLGVPFLRSRYLPRLIVWCGSALIIGMIALFGGAIFWLHQQALRDAESRLAQLNLVLTEQVERSLQSVDTVLQTLAAVAARGDLFDPSVSSRMRTYLANQAEASPHVRAFLVMNGNGDLVIDSSNPTPRSYNGADRDNFRFLKSAETHDVHIAAPLLGRLSGEWLFTVSRRLEDGNGAFAGIISSVVDVRYFAEFFESVKLGDDSRITLWRDDGTFLVGTPFVERRLGKKHDEMTAWIAGLGGKTAGVLRQNGLVSGEERMTSFNRMKTYPTLVQVSRTIDGILSPWRGEAYALAIFALIATLILCGIGWVLLRMAKAQENLLLSAYEARAHAEYASKLAERANRQKTKFFSAVSHDLRTPLCTISGFSDLMLAGHAGPLTEKAHDYVENIQNSGKYLLELLNDLLDMGKLEAGRLTLSDDEFALRSVVMECLRQSAALSTAARVALAPYAENAFGLRADPLRMRQILFNLLSNAIKFTPAGGRVEIATTRASDGSLRIAVSDSGIGMSHDEINTALEPYGQVRNDFTRTREGTGLGLPLVKALVDMHGGRLEIESEAGKGTTVTVVLPSNRVLYIKSGTRVA
jgi:signal transduction histidine kinase